MKTYADGLREALEFVREQRAEHTGTQAMVSIVCADYLNRAAVKIADRLADVLEITGEATQ